MAEYSNVRIGKLKLKGQKEKDHKKSKSKKSSERKRKNEDEQHRDFQRHGGWWEITSLSEISGPVAIEIGDRCYVKALDNGLFVLGAPHDEGDGPSPEEIFTAFPAGDLKVAFKSGYGKYLGVDKSGNIVGRSDAIGAVEQWEPVFQEGKLAISAANGKFVSVCHEDDGLIARSAKAGPEEMIKLRTNKPREGEEERKRKMVPEEEQGSVDQIEINYVKKFQKFQDKKMRVCSEDKGQLSKAKDEGYLHEALLDRRSKMKADRYCK
nr:EOG090X0DUJ [Eulimnadia texana]